ncbi:hypothetical protein QYE76_050385 [Lolium multiflorum]|uniref:DUF4283 domain-containing protein n=1 Tax=Lolium multiflorum TaxID=4521 RepID=A0AAD8SRJ8_LOLMU|nr:hypothetical protein QYE76_050385 [Lolium multiflorum]
MATGAGRSRAGASGLGKAKDVDALLRDLRFGEEEFDDLVIEDDIAYEEEPNLMAIACVLTDKTFSTAVFEDNMRFTWILAQKVQFRDIGRNTFILQMTCLGDWRKVVEEGPWLFQNWGIVIQPHNGYSRPSSLVLDRLPVWVQIHDILEAS